MVGPQGPDFAGLPSRNRPQIRPESTYTSPFTHPAMHAHNNQHGVKSSHSLNPSPPKMRLKRSTEVRGLADWAEPPNDFVFPANSCEVHPASRPMTREGRTNLRRPVFDERLAPSRRRRALRDHWHRPRAASWTDAGRRGSTGVDLLTARRRCPRASGFTAPTPRSAVVCPVREPVGEWEG